MPKMIAEIPVPYATLFQPAGFVARTVLQSPYSNLFLAGDQVSSSSLEAAMRSGETAAEAILHRR
jgi:predicted NAD/FAD-dependent oxidoreductase